MVTAGPALDATEQARLVRRREVSPLELVEAAIERIDRIDPALNAVVHRRFEAARAEAADRALPAGPLRGVPFLLKDLGAAQAGVPQTQGNVALRAAGHVAPADTPLGARFRAAGLVTLGVTNVPEFGLLADTQPLAYGPTRNPWRRDRSVGGSSGGAAAAVAAGLVPIGHASDGGGSIRIPAAWCGLVGLKPSRGRVPKPAHVTDLWGAELVVSRTVRDTALVLDAVHGHVPGALYRAAAPSIPYCSAIERRPGRLRIGMLAAVSQVAVHPECSAAVEEAAALLERLGHMVEPGWPAALLESPPPELEAIAVAELFEEVLADLEADLGRPVGQQDVEPYVWARRPTGPPVSARAAERVRRWVLGRSARLLAWWETGFDLLLTPTMCEPAPALADLAALSPAEMAMTERRHVAFVEPFNASGQPAITVPGHWTPDGLPVGVQLVARPDCEDQLLQVATQLEEVRPWASLWPSMTS